jgi:hypothetical protein
MLHSPGNVDVVYDDAERRRFAPPSRRTQLLSPVGLASRTCDVAVPLLLQHPAGREAVRETSLLAPRETVC